MAAGTPVEEQTLGELVATASRDLSLLLHREVDLARAELKTEMLTAGKGIGGLGAAAALGFPALLMFGVAAALGIAYDGIGIAYGLTAIGGLLFVVGLALLAAGGRQLMKVRPPERSIRSIRTDVGMVRHPTEVHDPQTELERAAQAK